MRAMWPSRSRGVQNRLMSDALPLVQRSSGINHDTDLTATRSRADRGVCRFQPFIPVSTEGEVVFRPNGRLFANIHLVTVYGSRKPRKLLMRTLQVFHSIRLAVLLGSGLLCLLGSVAGCDSSDSPPSAAAAADVKAKQEAEEKARDKAFGKAGIAPTVPAKRGTSRPKS